jgi:tetraacyldisaccharide 4'-kinase
MNPLSAAFGAVVKARNRLYERGLFATDRLQWPVISVGNLSVGGSGKTPFTILLGELLQERKLAFDILSRGYKRKTSGVQLVEEGGIAADYGDEPLLLAEKLHVPVVVCEDRVAAGRYAEQSFSQLKPAHGDHWYHLLDDGFQHRRLARAFDIVLVNPEDMDDQLLPLGRLREPLTALERADAIVVPESMDVARLTVFGKPIWRVQRSILIDRDKLPTRPIVICGIAKPQRFISDLRRHSVDFATTVTYDDHHAYTPSDVEHLVRLSERHKSEGFITTEKDAINLRPHRDQLPSLVVVPLQTKFVGGEAPIDHMLMTIEQRLRSVSQG